jgi:hypothetical protein
MGGERLMGRAGARMAVVGQSPEIAAEMSRLVRIARGLLLVAFVITFFVVTTLGT